MNISVTSGGFFFLPLFLVLPLPHTLSFVFILREVVGIKLMRLLKKAQFWYIYSGPKKVEIPKLKISSCKHEYSSVAPVDILGVVHHLHVTNSSNPLKIQLLKLALKTGILKGLSCSGLPDQDATLELWRTAWIFE